MHASDMLNNSSREADNTQLYLGYFFLGGGVSSSLPLLDSCRQKIKGITLKDRTGQRGK